MPKIDSTIACCRRGKVLSRMVCDSGTSGAPAPPCRMRHTTSTSSDPASPHSRVDTENPAIPHTMTLLTPKRATSQPVIGVTTAVARILNVITQAISSWVAESAPCICGRMVEVVSSAVEYSEEPSTTAIRISQRRPAEMLAAGSASILALVVATGPHTRIRVRHRGPGTAAPGVTSARNYASALLARA